MEPQVKKVTFHCTCSGAQSIVGVLNLNEYIHIPQSGQVKKKSLINLHNTKSLTIIISFHLFVPEIN